MMRFPETAAAVAALLADPDASVRTRVAHALGDLQAAAAIPMLRQHIGDADAGVAGEMRWALAEMD